MKYIEHYNLNKDKIFSYFYYNLSKNRELAEDLTSDTFLKWFEKFETYNDEFAFSTWIFTIARNTLFDYYRKNKINVTLDESTEITHTEFLQYEQDFSKKIDIDNQMEDVYTLLNTLSESSREIVIMKYLQELTTKEISEISWKTQANVRKIISRSLQKLTTLLLANTQNYEKI